MVDKAVEIAKVAGSVADIDLSVWTLIAQADIVVKGVMLLLVVASIVCWAIIFDKIKYYRAIRYRGARFENAYRSSRALKALYDKISKKDPGSPMAEMFVMGVSEVYGKNKKSRFDDPAIVKEKLLNTLYRVKHHAIEKMEKKLIILATVGSASPFVGLFGTVWGIVNSFQAIAATKNTTLAVVAPGIAEALLATAIGLFAAIPAVIFYNMFSNEIRSVSGRLDDFASELSTNLAYSDE